VVQGERARLPPIDCASYIVCGSVGLEVGSEFEDGYALVETKPPQQYVGKTLGEAGIRRQHRVTVVSIKRRGQDFSYATADTVLDADDLLIVAGKSHLAERFAAEA
jgi:Trk K+ transport system NAD-binding subunit